MLGDLGRDLGADAAELGASCTTTAWPVLRTLASTVSMSSGVSERRSMTSSVPALRLRGVGRPWQVRTIGP